MTRRRPGPLYRVFRWLWGGSRSTPASQESVTMTDGGDGSSSTEDSVNRPRRVMLDLETLGLDPGATILSLGAVEFDEDGLGEMFHRNISLTSCEDAGLQIDADTLEWWLGQDEAVQDVLTGGNDLRDVLVEFDEFYADADEIWANSPSFDCAILDHAYEAVGGESPWAFYDERCFRTLKSLPQAADVEMEGDEHDALDDAVHQAKIASRTLQRYADGQ